MVWVFIGSKRLVVFGVERREFVVDATLCMASTLPRAAAYHLPSTLVAKDWGKATKFGNFFCVFSSFIFFSFEIEFLPEVN